MSLVLTHVADGIATITLNRPEKLNALTTALCDEVIAALRTDRKSTRLNSSHIQKSRMPSSA